MMKMGRLAKDGTTTEPVSIDQFLRCERGQENTNFYVHLATSRIDNLIRLIHTLVILFVTIHN